MAEELRTYRLVATHGVPTPMFTYAAWRVLDAAMRCQELETLVDEAAASWAAHVYARARKSDFEGSVRLDFPGVNDEQAELGRRATTLASEAIHHARTALDYCVHHGAWLDNGVRNNRTQFPLVDTEADWTRIVEGNRLAGLSDEHVAWIYSVQPLHGIGWSGSLRRVSNQDKHRVAIEILPAYGIEISMSELTEDPLGDPDYLGFGVRSRTIELLMSDGFSSSETQSEMDALQFLWEIILGVAGVVNQFLVLEGNNPIEITTTRRDG